MANLVNLQEFDAQLRSLKEHLEKAGQLIEISQEQARQLRMVGMMRVSGKPAYSRQSIDEQFIDAFQVLNSALASTVMGLTTAYHAFVQLAHNNRDGRG